MKRTGIVILVVLGIGCSNKSEVDKLNFLKRGNMAYSDGNASEALRYYNEALKIDSAFVDAWNNRGLAEMQQNLFDEAIFSFEKAIRYKPDYTEALLNSVKANIKVHQHYAALSSLENLQQLWGDSSIIFFTRGLIYHDMKKNELAMENLKLAWDKDSTNIETLINIANVHYHNKEYATAVRLLQQALIKDADNPMAYNILGMAYAETGKLEEALTTIELASSFNKRDPYISNNRGYILIKLDSLNAAEEELIRSMKLDPYNPWVYRNLGLLRVAQENYSEAERMLARAYEMDPLIENISYDYIDVLLQTNNYDQACAIAKSDSINIGRYIALKEYCK